MAFVHRLATHICRVPLKVSLRIVVATVLLWPILIAVLVASSWKATRWRSHARCRRWLQEHREALPDVDPRSLRIESSGGGVCNAGFVWHCRTLSGHDKRYFIKVFLPLGTFWAKVCPWLSPFPKVPAAQSGERLKAEHLSRVALAQRRVAVPALLYCDPINHLTVSECLEGEMVHELLDRVAQHGQLTSEEREILAQCGRGLAQIHAAGFSVIDAQPANCMWVPDRRRVYFLDLEFCTREDQRRWDLEFFFTYLRAQLPETLAAEAVQEVEEGYRAVQPRLSRSPTRIRRLLAPFVPVFRAILEVRRSLAPARKSST